MKTLRIEVRGIVQGVGFRPFVHRAADACGVRGSVANRGSYVEIFAQGARDRVERFLGMLRNEPPERSLVMKISATETDLPEAREFAIVESAREEGDIFVSPDIATCPRCREELFNPGDRRYLHPFINCTACGPRLTILDSMPYDRERTSMGAFPMCRACAWEYTHAETRRYDAQPVCCNDCGPQVYMLDGGERGAAAITAARRRLMAGGIGAVKG
ncbi:MAG: acylphosphatase, partial [Desulfovibrio sp.]|nr:acylphosphatase [Desulfovibrio sp.]